MPGWHEATQKHRETGAIQTVGIVQEQHPDRTRLFMQWQRMDWPVLVDALNLLAVEVVPITLLIDEQGIIRFRGDLESLDAFLALERPASELTPEFPAPPDLDQLASTARDPESQRRHADALFLWGGPSNLDLAIATYSKILAAKPSHGATHFRLGVAHRSRYDSEHRKPDDFQRAVAHWGKALELNPNQYIWRRRIQQYGPRLDKPYPFYDWVEEARRDIQDRGETPAVLPVEPRGAEIAHPSKSFATSPTQQATSPDSQGKIYRDENGYIAAELTLVPASLAPGAAGRVHAVFRPNEAIQAHWNNEVDDLTLWIDPPPGWQVDQRQLQVPNPQQAVSSEVRRLELEIRSPDDFAAPVTLQGYALYYVCEDVRGSCLYRRQDLELEILPKG
ncbi:MAG: hypothetical protein AAF560_13350 [Acidobacteriota bacterium]